MMAILVALFSQGAEAWLKFCATTEGQRVLAVTVKLFWESFSLVSDQYAFAHPSLSVVPLCCFPSKCGTPLLGFVDLTVIYECLNATAPWQGL